MLLVGGGEEDALDGLAHVGLGQELVALIEHEVLHLRQVQGLLGRGEVQNTAGGADDDVGHLHLQGGHVGLDVDSSVEHAGLDVGQVLGEALVLLLDLEGQLAGVAQHDDVDLAGHGVQQVQRGEHEHGGLAHTGLGLADDVLAEDGVGDALVLNYSGEEQTGRNNLSKLL